MKSTLAPGHNDNRKDQNQRNHAVLQFLTFNSDGKSSLIDSEATTIKIFPNIFINIFFLSIGFAKTVRFFKV